MKTPIQIANDIYGLGCREYGDRRGRAVYKAIADELREVDAETFDFISTLREIYHNNKSGTYARQMAIRCLDKHQISVNRDNNNIKPCP